MTNAFVTLPGMLLAMAIVPMTLPAKALLLTKISQAFQQCYPLNTSNDVSSSDDGSLTVEQPGPPHEDQDPDADGLGLGLIADAS